MVNALIIKWVHLFVFWKKISIVAILKSEICFLEIGVLFDEIAISHNDFKNF